MCGGGLLYYISSVNIIVNVHIYYRYDSILIKLIQSEGQHNFDNVQFRFNNTRVPINS